MPWSSSKCHSSYCQETQGRGQVGGAEDIWISDRVLAFYAHGPRFNPQHKERRGLDKLGSKAKGLQVGAGGLCSGLTQRELRVRA